MELPAGTRVIVALSGGVDSAVAALRLVRAGCRVEGLHMTNWDDADPACTARQDLADARSVATDLGIPLHQANFAAEYRDRVFAAFLHGHAHGLTPNPDVDCNRFIKFGVCLDHARRLGADWLATGHYARVDHGPPPRLLLAADAGKDQTYFLHAIDPAALARVVFPLGDLTKAGVRRLAADAGLRVHAKRDSTGICFIGRRPFAAFLGQHLPDRDGDIVDADGRVRGHHRGLSRYTIGQRQGSGIGGQRGETRPWYVAAKDLDRNRLVVVPGHDHPRLWTRCFTVGAARWLGGAAPDGPLGVRVRHRHPLVPCRLAAAHGGRFAVTTDDPVYAVTPGQYAVFYRGDECLGGGPVAAAGDGLPL
jgi:tRNA-specific 2-thiouridylase